MSDQHPFVSIIVPHYNDLGGLALCMRTLAAQTYPRDRWELIVADNASPQGLTPVQEVVGDLGRVILVETKGAGPARNGAVEHAKGEILAFIDSDCRADANWLEEGVKALQDYDLVGGKVTIVVQDPATVTPVEAFECVFGFNFEMYINRMGFTGAGNLFCSRRLFDHVGGFKNGMSEDVEWSRRAVAMGHRLGYAPRAEVAHPARRTWEELIRKWRRVNAELFLLAAGARGSRVRWLVRALAMPLSAVAHTPRVLSSPQLHGLGQRIGALKVLYAIRFWRMFDGLALLGRPADPTIVSAMAKTGGG